MLHPNLWELYQFQQLKKNVLNVVTNLFPLCNTYTFFLIWYIFNLCIFNCPIVTFNNALGFNSIFDFIVVRKIHSFISHFSNSSFQMGCRGFFITIPISYLSVNIMSNIIVFLCRKEISPYMPLLPKIYIEKLEKWSSRNCREIPEFIIKVFMFNFK